MAAEASVFHYDAIIPDASERRVLLVPDGDGRWALPRVTRAEAAYPYFGALLRAFQEQWGLSLWVRRVVHSTGSPREGAEQTRVLACENRAFEPEPPGARWVGRAELAGLSLAEPAHRAVLETWLEEADGAPPPLRVPWAEAGWFRAAEVWIGERLAEHGLSVTAPIEQVKAWSISCLLRAPTEAGPVYFKAVPPLFGSEPVITGELSRCCPGQVPEVLALGPERHWLLLREIGGTPLRGMADLALWEEALRRYARFQIERIGEEERLRAWGCADRRLGGLAPQFDLLLAEIAAPAHRARYGLSEEEADRVAAIAPRVRARVAELAAAGVPETLVHGDLHGGNVLVDGERIVFFDWTDAALAHPFFDLITMFRELPDLPGARERVRDAYLEPWTDLFSPERLRAAFALAMQVAPLYHALSYRYIAVNTEPSTGGGLAGGLGHFLRGLLPS